MDGEYDLKINSPMGMISGKLYLKQSGNIMNGTLEVMGSKNTLTGGKAQGNRCYFSGEFKNNMLNVKYDIAAELVGKILNIYAKTNMGEFKIEANKIR